MENSSITYHLSVLVKDFKEYIELKYQFTRLDSIEKAVAITSFLATGLILMFLAVGIFLFISIGLGFLFGKVLQNNFYGFSLMAGIYLVIAIFLYIFRNSLIKRPVQRNLLKTIFKDGNGSD